MAALSECRQLPLHAPYELAGVCSKLLYVHVRSRRCLRRFITAVRLDGNQVCLRSCKVSACTFLYIAVNGKVSSLIGGFE